MTEKIPVEDIVYHPTFNCNLSCRGCVNYSNHLETRKMPDETNWSRDLDILFDRFDINHLEIAGGETLMFPHLQDLINKLTPVKNYTISTNGLLLHKNLWLKEVLDTDTRMMLRISVHGDPLLDSVYIKNLSNSMAIFLNVSAERVRKDLCRQVVNKHDYKEFGYLERIIIQPFLNPTSWRYPKLDSNELPILFNNNKEEAYKRCISPAMHIKDGKIYRCPMTAMLIKVVKSKNLYSDKWQFLKDYVPYDLLTDHNANEWDRLHIAEDVCTRCPVTENEWDHKKTDIHSKIIYGPSILE